MCGIVGYIGSAFQASQIVLDGLEKLEYRGYDSAGIAVYQKSDGKIHVRRDSGKLRNIRQELEKDLTSNDVGIGHTRWATHGRPTQNNAHPHKDHEGRVVVVHNGIIENYLDIKEKLLAAKRAGIKIVIIPLENEKDLKDIPKNCYDGITIKPVRWIDDVLELALNK